MEAGFGLRYVASARGLTVEGRVRGLLTHSDGTYEEWGAAPGGAERLWTAAPAPGLAPDEAFAAKAGLKAELGYGLRPPAGAGVLTPYAGFSMAGNGAARTYRIGTRWTAQPAFALALEARHGRADGDTEPAVAALLRASFRW
ncbi:MAG: hypothetical protein OXU42_12705 [Deltaproteobacteria bacterium]|nr:hypothetical protein [Deltaproteobacteria bacterium]